MAHELNQPLAGVRGIAEQLLIGMERGWETSDGALKEQLEMIVEQADRMAHIIEPVRRFAGEAGSPEISAVRVNDVVRSAIGLIGVQLRARGIEVALEMGSDLPLVEINPFSLEEVVLNLLNNARDAVEEAERAEGGEERVVKVSTRGAAAGVEVVVEDRGAGIPRMPTEWTSTGPLKRTKWRRSGF